MIYPGRLYIFDFPAFQRSLEKLVSFSNENEITYILGCHIEMTRTTKKDYHVTTRYQPHKPPLEMTTKQLNYLKEKVNFLENKNGIYRYDDFIIWIGANRLSAIRLVIKAFFYNLKKRD